jgi:alpha-L-arabinofuranosidase
VQLNLAGMGKISSSAKVIVLAGGLRDENSFAEPQKISPKEATLVISSPEFQHEFPANSLTIIRLK